MPGAKQAWPNSAACWSPAMPRIGMGAPNRAGSVLPNSAAQSSTSGSRLGGMSNSASSSSSQRWVWMSNSRVRAALLASVRCTRPPVRRQSRKLSTVPKRNSPRSARSRAPGTWSRSQRSLVAEKYGSSSRPVFAATRGSWPAVLSTAQSAAVRRSCQTMAGWISAPLAASHTRVVSRWLVMPMAAICRACRPAWLSAAWHTCSTPCQISSPSCSTQPSRGKCWRNSCWAWANTRPAASKTMARLLVVPWSMASR
ncbi:hypothetical protein D3C86_1430010 [compost metagenome]